MTETGAVFPVDMQAKRLARGWSREVLAVKIGTSAHHVYRIESRRRSISFPLALACSEVLDGLTIEDEEGRRFLLAPTGGGNGNRREEIPNDEQLHDLNVSEHIDHVRNQAADVASIADRLQMRWLAIRNGCASGRNDFADFYAELWELKWAADGAIEDGQKDRPDVVDEGRERAVARRPLYEGGESVEQVA